MMTGCVNPFAVKDQGVLVPCGKCAVCIARRVSAWSFRLMQQDRVATTSHFITLTYANEYVPLTDSGYMSLCKRDLQLFFKRLRKRGSPGIKYYAVGEYGSKTHRPHYHILLFNASVADVELAWQLGDMHFGTVSGASVGYTLKYMSKGPIKRKDHWTGRTAEFALMSKGLGRSYFKKSRLDWHRADPVNRVYLTAPGGIKLSMPRYYKDYIFSVADRALMADHFAKLAEPILLSRNERVSHEHANKNLLYLSCQNDRL